MPKEKYLLEYIALEKAISITKIACELKNMPVVTRSLQESVGLIIAESITTHKDIPPEDRAEMDGYAVKNIDLKGASSKNPVKLKLIKNFSDIQRSCLSIATGDYIYPPFNAVIMEEYTQKSGNFIEFFYDTQKGSNISVRGLDYKNGDNILSSGKILTEFDIAGIATLGIKNVKVYRKPKVSILNTGNELISLGNKPKLNQKINTNGIMLHSLLENSGIDVNNLDLVPDDIEKIKEKLVSNIKSSDAIIVTGGTAVSDRDLVIDSIKKAGGKILVRGISLRPARPTGSSILNGKPIFTLSGNPVACAIGCIFFALPVLQKMFSIPVSNPNVIKGVLTSRVSCPPNFRCFVRVKIEKKNGVNMIKPLALKGAGILNTLIRADGFLIIPENKEGFDQGETVSVQTFHNNVNTDFSKQNNGDMT